MSRNYKFNNPEAAYFMSFAVVKWLDVFTRNDIHNNPVEEGLAFRAEDYMYSSAVDHSGEKGMIDNIIVVREL